MNNRNPWVEMQQQFQQLWQSVLQQSYGSIPEGAANSGLNGFWNQFATGPRRAVGPDAFSQWLNQSLQDILRAPLQGWPFPFDNNTSPFSGPNWSPMSPPEFAVLRNLPPLGFNQASEIRWCEAQDACAEQAKASAALGRQLAAVYTTAIQRFQKTIAANDSEDGEITNLRALYDLWVSIADQAYAEKVMTAEYSRAFGDCINSSARARNAWQELTEEAQHAMNLPNRRELDSLIERQHALQVEVSELSHRMEGAGDISALNTKIEALSQQLYELSRSADKRSGSPATAKPEKPSVPATSVSGPTKVKRTRRTPKRSKKATKSALAPGNEVDIGSFTSPVTQPNK
ncbi:MAG: poly(R)-hydroxyalkanoic acid synthase subunit PhaE [Gammaproteobacteria bacterium]